MISKVDIDFTKALPKVELHAHLSGSISNETLHNLWLRKQSEGLCLDLEDPLTAIRPGGDGFVDIHTFFPLFDKYIYALCDDIESVKYVCGQVIQDFEKDGVRLLELRTTPRSCAATGMTKLDYMEAVNEVVYQWNRTSADSMEVNLILSIDRRMTAEQAMEVVDLAIQYLRYSGQGGFVVGLDLCGNPTIGEVSIFTLAFQKGRAHELGITAHFAEVLQSSSDHELSTILSWKPDRLGHCIHVGDSFKDIISSRFLGLEICLSCNTLTGLTTGGFSKHHLGAWLQRQCPIALSTDDVGIFGSPLSREYALAAEHFNLSTKDVVQLCRGAVSAAFTGHERMGRLIDEFERTWGLA